MIHISNLRKESAGEWTRLIADITQLGGGQNYLENNSEIWFAVKNENAHMLSDDVYDAFVLVPLYMAMYYKQDLHIHGCVSKRLYRNVMNYLQRILCDFSDDLSRVDVHVEGFKEADGEHKIIGAGISCGVDSLTTIYDRYVHEDDPEYKINALFLFNCGTHGDYGEKSERLYQERYAMNKSAADELGLPVYQVESNLHAFTHPMGPDPKAGYFAIWSCIFALQRAIGKYYVSSCNSYNELVTICSGLYRNVDLAGFCESYAVPLLSTEQLELIIDGCQYERNQKTEKISGWYIAQKYLNVCVLQAHNCSHCTKCLRTIFALDVIGKLEKFAGVFDIDTYREYSFMNKCDIVINRDKDAHKLDNYNLAKSHRMNLPSYFIAYMYLLPSKIMRFTKRVMRKLMGERIYEFTKRIIKH